jgi:predicted esterase
MKRRDFVAMGTLGAASYLAARVAAGGEDDPRLKARPGVPSAALEPGRHALPSRDGRGGILYVPKGYDPKTPTALALMLHGAGNSSEGMEFLFAPADQYRVIVVAPDSRDLTWDAVSGEFGPDVRYIDASLTFAFRRCPVDPKRLAIGGFSDGASYALSLGLANGDLFNEIIAFSPGFIAGLNGVGAPRIFISHGREDNVLPIDKSSREIVAKLKASGYDVKYQEFAGNHAVPPDIARQALAWFVAGAPLQSPLPPRS